MPFQKERMSLKKIPMIIRRFVLPIVMFAIVNRSLPACAQWFPETLLSSPALSKTDSNRFSVAADVTGFFKNNEYFSPVADGQTLPGVSALLAAGYQVADKFRAELGVYGVKYSGRDPLENFQPFARLQYSLTPAFNMVLGNIYGGVNHRLIEPLYQWERQFTANPESGLQFVLHSDRWFTDVWVDWQNFIQRGDPEQEALTFGTSVSYNFNIPSVKLNIAVPLQLLIYHRGGQIDTSDEPMIVLGNAATGLCIRRSMDFWWFRSVGVDVYAVGYYDRYPNKDLRPYKSSLSVYPVFHIDASSLQFMAGYWLAEKFYAFEGEPLFFSFNPYEPQQRLPERKMVTVKFAYERELLKGIYLGTQVELYSDLKRRETDYSFGVHLRFNERFLLGK